jgi:methylenetetrahydrofolate reductase (NADPH)
MATMNGSAVPAALVERLEAVADDPAARLDIAVEVATDVCQRLIDAGAPGIHLYALNRSAAVLRITANLGLHPADN